MNGRVNARKQDRKQDSSPWGWPAGGGSGRQGWDAAIVACYRAAVIGQVIAVKLTFVPLAVMRQRWRFFLLLLLYHCPILTQLHHPPLPPWLSLLHISQSSMKKTVWLTPDLQQSPSPPALSLSHTQRHTHTKFLRMLPCYCWFTSLLLNQTNLNNFNKFKKQLIIVQYVKLLLSWRENHTLILKYSVLL